MKNKNPTLIIKLSDPKIKEIMDIVSVNDMDYSISSVIRIKISPEKADIASNIMKLANDWNLR